MGQIFINEGSAILATALDATTTTVTVDRLSTAIPSLGASDYFLATLYSHDDSEGTEILKVTAVNGNTWTVVRGYENTAARSHLKSAGIELRLTAESIQRKVDIASPQVLKADAPPAFSNGVLSFYLADNTQVNLTIPDTDTWRPVVNNLTSTSTTSGLTANQGRLLKGMIDNINQIISSDTTTLDEIQEIVDFIQQNRESLDNLTISNIAGLVNALDGKLATNGTAVNAEKLEGRTLETSPVAGSVVQRDGSQDISARLFRSNFQNQSSVDSTAAMAFRNDAADNYIRFVSDKAYIRGWLGVAAVSHNHPISDITGLDSALANKLGATAKAVDSDKLDGIQGTSFARRDQANTFAGDVTVNGKLFIENGRHSINNNDGSGNFNIKVGVSADTAYTSTENGYASHWVFDQGQGSWTFKTSDSNKAEGATHTFSNVMTLDRNGNVTFTGNVNGAGTNIKPANATNADKLGNVAASDYVRKSTTNTFSQKITATGGVEFTDVSWASNAVTITGVEPNVFFKQTDTGVSWMVGVNGGAFYILDDSNSDGSFDGTPYPFQLTPDTPLKINGNTVYDASNANRSNVDWNANHMTLAGNLNMNATGQRIVFNPSTGSTSYIENNGGVDLVIASDDVVTFRETDANVAAVTISTNNKTVKAVGGFIGDLTGNADTADTLKTARTINGTSFNGGADITTSKWGAARNITIGDTTKSVNGSANVSFSRAEVGITKANIDALGVNASTLGGKSPSSTTSNTADSIAVRDGAADISARLFRSTYDSSTTIASSASLAFRNSAGGTNDNYIRFCSSPEAIRGWLETYSTTEVDSLTENKQDTLVSGTSIKTVNGSSLLGSGDLSISSVPSSFGAVGTVTIAYVYVASGVSVNPGTVYSGSSLYFGSSSYTHPSALNMDIDTSYGFVRYSGGSNPSGLSGSWRLLTGFKRSDSGGSGYFAGLFLRIY